MIMILAYQSVQILSSWFSWLLGIGAVVVSLSCVYTVLRGLIDDEELSEIGKQLKTKLLAAAILLTTLGLIQLFQKYFF